MEESVYGTYRKWPRMTTLYDNQTFDRDDDKSDVIMMYDTSHDPNSMDPYGNYRIYHPGGDPKAGRPDSDMRSKEEGSSGSDATGSRGSLKRRQSRRVVFAFFLIMVLIGVVVAAIILAVLLTKTPTAAPQTSVEQFQSLIRLENVSYHDALKDSNSSDFKNLQAEFCKKLISVLNTSATPALSEELECKVSGFWNGGGATTEAIYVLRRKTRSSGQGSSSFKDLQAAAVSVIRTQVSKGSLGTFDVDRTVLCGAFVVGASIDQKDCMVTTTTTRPAITMTTASSTTAAISVAGPTTRSVASSTLFMTTNDPMTSELTSPAAVTEHTTAAVTPFVIVTTTAATETSTETSTVATAETSVDAANSTTTIIPETATSEVSAASVTATPELSTSLEPFSATSQNMSSTSLETNTAVFEISTTATPQVSTTDNSSETTASTYPESTTSIAHETTTLQENTTTANPGSILVVSQEYTTTPAENTTGAYIQPNTMSLAENTTEYQLSTTAAQTENTTDYQLSTTESQTENTTDYQLSTTASQTENTTDYQLSTTASQTENTTDYQLSTTESKTENTTDYQLSTTASQTENTTDYQLSTTASQTENTTDYQLSTTASQTENTTDYQLSTTASQTENTTDYQLSTTASQTENTTDYQLSTTASQTENTTDYQLSTTASQTENTTDYQLSTTASQTENTTDYQLSTTVAQTENTTDYQLSTTASQTENTTDYQLSTTVAQTENTTDYQLSTTASQTENTTDYQLSTTVAQTENTTDYQLSTTASQTENTTDYQLSTTASQTENTTDYQLSTTTVQTENTSYYQKISTPNLTENATSTYQISTVVVVTESTAFVTPEKNTTAYQELTTESTATALSENTTVAYPVSNTTETENYTTTYQNYTTTYQNYTTTYQTSPETSTTANQESTTFVSTENATTVHQESTTFPLTINASSAYSESTVSVGYESTTKAVTENITSAYQESTLVVVQESTTIAVTENSTSFYQDSTTTALTENTTTTYQEFTLNATISKQTMSTLGQETTSVLLAASTTQAVLPESNTTTQPELTTGIQPDSTTISPTLTEPIKTAPEQVSNSSAEATIETINMTMPATSEMTTTTAAMTSSTVDVIAPASADIIDTLSTTTGGSASPFPALPAFVQSSSVTTGLPLEVASTASVYTIVAFIRPSATQLVYPEAESSIISAELPVSLEPSISSRASVIETLTVDAHSMASVIPEAFTAKIPTMPLVFTPGNPLATEFVESTVSPSLEAVVDSSFVTESLISATGTSTATTPSDALIIPVMSSSPFLPEFPMSLSTESVMTSADIAAGVVSSLVESFGTSLESFRASATFFETASLMSVSWANAQLVVATPVLSADLMMSQASDVSSVTDSVEVISVTKLPDAVIESLASSFTVDIPSSGSSIRVATPVVATPVLSADLMMSEAFDVSSVTDSFDVISATKLPDAAIESLASSFTVDIPSSGSSTRVATPVVATHVLSADLMMSEVFDVSSVTDSSDVISVSFTMNFPSSGSITHVATPVDSTLPVFLNSSTEASILASSVTPSVSKIAVLLSPDAKEFVANGLSTSDAAETVLPRTTRVEASENAQAFAFATILPTGSESFNVEPSKNFELLATSTFSEKPSSPNITNVSKTITPPLPEVTSSLDSMSIVPVRESASLPLFVSSSVPAVETLFVPVMTSFVENSIFSASSSVSGNPSELAMPTETVSASSFESMSQGESNVLYSSDSALLQLSLPSSSSAIDSAIKITETSPLVADVTDINLMESPSDILNLAAQSKSIDIIPSPSLSVDVLATFSTSVIEANAVLPFGFTSATTSSVGFTSNSPLSFVKSSTLSQITSRTTPAARPPTTTLSLSILSQSAQPPPTNNIGIPSILDTLISADKSFPANGSTMEPKPDSRVNTEMQGSWTLSTAAAPVTTPNQSVFLSDSPAPISSSQELPASALVSTESSSVTLPTANPGLRGSEAAIQPTEVIGSATSAAIPPFVDTVFGTLSDTSTTRSIDLTPSLSSTGDFLLQPSSSISDAALIIPGSAVVTATPVLAVSASTLSTLSSMARDIAVAAEISMMTATHTWLVTSPVPAVVEVSSASVPADNATFAAPSLSPPVLTLGGLPFPAAASGTTTSNASSSSAPNILTAIADSSGPVLPGADPMPSNSSWVLGASASLGTTPFVFLETSWSSADVTSTSEYSGKTIVPTATVDFTSFAFSAVPSVGMVDSSSTLNATVIMVTSVYDMMSSTTDLLLNTSSVIQ